MESLNSLILFLISSFMLFCNKDGQTPIFVMWVLYHVRGDVTNRGKIGKLHRSIG